MKRKFRISGLAAALALAMVPQVSQAGTYAPWLTQIGITDSIESAANWGQGQLLGVVDTGIVYDNQMFAPGQVSQALSACRIAAGCSAGFTDDNSHGTAVASIAAGNTPSPYSFYVGPYLVTAGSYIGVAPNANIVAEKVLSAQGTGYMTDLATGIVAAADAGAGVINVSITYGNQAEIVNAINYAASKGAFIVWAGGNSSMTLLGGANTTGLTKDAISHLVFAGSVNAQNSRSSFSNVPGKASKSGGNLVSTSGSRTAYSTRWIMAPGESILAPIVTYGPDAWGSWAGTSMAAPIISGSLILLEGAWPILKTQGTAANLLLATTTDLGSRGVDATYGTGLVNLGKAFQPYGKLTVSGAKGKSYVVTSLNGKLLTGGALGDLASIKPLLADYTAFDSYTRNFTVNLSGLLATRSAKYSLNPLPVNENTGPKAVSLASGYTLVSDRLGDGSRMMAMRDPEGATLSFGYGSAPQFAYAQALYDRPQLAEAAYVAGGSNFAEMVQGGAAMAYGASLDADTRWAVMFGQNDPLSAQPGDSALTSGNSDNQVAGVALAVSHRLGRDASLALTVGQVQEKDGLLGTTSGTSQFGFGNAVTDTATLSLAYAIDRNVSLLGEAGVSQSRSAGGEGLFGSTRNVVSQSFGLSLLAKALASNDDRLVVSFRQPMRVTSGSVDVVVASVMADGTPSYTNVPISLVPDGHETDFRIAYDLAVNRRQNLDMYLTDMHDALNVAGNHIRSFGVSWSGHF